MLVKFLSVASVVSFGLNDVSPLGFCEIRSRNASTSQFSRYFPVLCPGVREAIIICFDTLALSHCSPKPLIYSSILYCEESRRQREYTKDIVVPVRGFFDAFALYLRATWSTRAGLGRWRVQSRAELHIFERPFFSRYSHYVVSLYTSSNR
ncbi:hypothetical protein EDB86DRAFT_824681 [Lactarius hatsudake]|nr:hypothetical protein EDB86DRAFT_824681 [Lactarius hatsudake]